MQKYNIAVVGGNLDEIEGTAHHVDKDGRLVIYGKSANEVIAIYNIGIWGSIRVVN